MPERQKNIYSNLLSRYLIIVACLFCVLTSPTYAQNNFHFKHYSIKNGLSQSSVNCIFQDHQGYIWFGTLDGLNKFDGYNITTYKYNPFDEHSISNNNVNTIFEDSKHNLWMGIIDGGISKYASSSNDFERYYKDKNLHNTLISNNIKNIVETADGKMWFSSDEGISLLNEKNKSFKNFTTDNGLFSNNIVALSAYENELWVFYSNSLQIIDCSNFAIKDVKINFDSEHNFIKTKRINNEIWIGTQSGIYIFEIQNKEGKTILAQKSQGLLPHHKITAIADDKFNTVWVGTADNGVFCINKNNKEIKKHITNNHRPTSLSNNSIQSIYINDDENVWIGTSLGGVNLWQRSQEVFKTFQNELSNPYSLSNNKVRCIFEASDKTVWVGTKEGGLCIWDRNTNKFHRYNKNNKINYVRTIAEDAKGRIWVSSAFDSLYVIDKKQNTCITHYIGSNSLKENSSQTVWSILKSKSGRMWFGSIASGLTYFDEKDKRFHSVKELLQENKNLEDLQITTLLEDKYQRIWIGTYNKGVKLLDLEQKTIIDIESHENGAYPKTDRIYSLVTDINSENIIWAGSRYSIRKINIENLQCTPISAAKVGFPSDVLMGVLQDDDYNLWVSTNSGLVKFNTKTYKTNTYNHLDGLQSNEYMIGAYCKLSTGEFTFGGVEGLDVFFPDSIKKNNRPPVLILSSLQVKNKEYRTDKNINTITEVNLEHNENDLAFEYMGIGFINPEKNKYQYRLVGKDKHWIDAGNRKYVGYTNLQAGKYTFEVRAANSDDVWSDETISLHIVIHPPIWSTKVFKIFIFIIIVILFYLLIKSRDFIRDKNQLAKVVEERTQEIKQQNEEIHSQNEEILTQRDLANLQKEEIRMQNEEIKRQHKKLEESSKDIQILSHIGRNIVSHLTIDEIIDTAYKSINKLFSVEVFYLGLLDNEKNELKFEHCIAFDKSIPSFIKSLDNNNSLAAWCYNNQSQIITDCLTADYPAYIDEKPSTVEGVGFLESVIYLPIFYSNKTIGVTSIQHSKIRKYQTYHLTIFKSIAVYLSLAINNAAAISKIEEQKKLLEQKTDSLQKLNATKDKFFSIVAHDLRNPFNTLINISELLCSQQDKYDRKQISNFIADINKSSKVAFNLLENLLHWARSQTDNLVLKLENIDLREIAIENIMLYEGNARQKNIILKNEIGHSIYAYADYNTIDTVVRNLLSNALKFTPTGGKITICAAKENDEIVVKVKDDGVGISETIIKNMFEIGVKHSTSGTNQEKGTGLGLILCKEFVTKNGGNIGVESEVNVGSTFYFSLREGIMPDKKTSAIKAYKNSITPLPANKETETDALIIETDDKLNIPQNEICLLSKKLIELRNQNRIRDISIFGQLLIDKGNQFNCPVLNTYGKTIVAKAASFDIDGIENTLESLSETLK